MNTETFDPRRPQRLVVLQHGGLLSTRHGKTGISLLRYRGEEIVAVVDRETAGRSLRELTQLPLMRDIPIVATVAESLALKPTALAIGLSPSGGRLPEAWVEDLRTAVRGGVSIWSGLHTRIGADPVIAAALRPGVHIWDMRREPENLAGGTGAARNLTCKRVLFVGTDMAIGKMTAALEFDRVARARGLRSAFVATGQAGMMIGGGGMCLDAVRVDYASGAVEAEVMRYGQDHDILWVEGQGSLLNPASTATLPLIRGSQPTHLVLVHKGGMKHLQSFAHIAVPPLRKVVELYEQVATAAGAFTAGPVAGVALNTWGQSDAEARAHIEATTRETGLPCTDAVRFGPGEILDRIVAG